MNPQQLEILEYKCKRLGESLNLESEEQKAIFSGLWKGFQQDEALLIKLMDSLPPKNGPYPKPTDPGNIEYGWALYFLNNTLPNHIHWLYDVLKFFDMPDSAISSTMWADWEKTWESSGVLMGDGSLVATQSYAVMDLGWSLAVIDYLLLQVDSGRMANFVTNPNKVVIDSSAQPSLKIAVIGDWGTGNYVDGSSLTSPATQIMSQIENLSPDMVIHLGDVYYAGTDNGIFPGDNEEQNNLVDAWTYNAPLGNFTLNSNHEMYDGAKGYYNVAMTSGLFEPYQTGTSYFSIEYGDYIILGMDSAYNATGMYMQGRITNSDQIQFMNEASNTGKKIVLMTHHNPIDTLGDSLNDLWTDVNDTNGLNNPPYMWYWGHIHNGIVYNSNAASGDTLSRCLGNGSIPIGTGRWLKNSNIDFFTNTPLNDGTTNNKLRVKNGFAILTFDSSGITETWYDQSGDVCWTNQA